MPEPGFLDQCRQILADRWATVLETDSADAVPEELLVSVDRCINSKTKTYRYVLPTQLVAKIAEPTLDARSTQAAWGRTGAFDARTVASKVIVPFDGEHHNVLGGSTDPYVSKPLREQAIIPDFRGNKKDQSGWDELCRILSAVEEGEVGYEPETVFNVVLIAIKRRLQGAKVVYPTPNRISLSDSFQLINEFLSQRSGGIRFEAVVAALFETIGHRFGLFDGVRCTQVNTSDQQAGTVADVECLDVGGNVVIAVEAKDREITVRQIEEKLSLMREQQIREAFFLSSVGGRVENKPGLDELLAKEFNSGQNIYILQLDRFLESMLSLFGESGRTQFLQAVGRQLDEYGRLIDRQAWAELLREI